MLPDQLAVSAAHEAFDESGKLKDAKRAAQVVKIARGLAEFLSKHL